MADQKISQLTDGGMIQLTDELVNARGSNNFNLLGRTGLPSLPPVADLTTLNAISTIGLTQGQVCWVNSALSFYYWNGLSWVEQEGFSPLQQQNVIYVAKAGNDSNDGKTFETPKLTFTSALSVSNIGDAIICIDGGTYTESLNLNKSVDIFAQSATLQFNNGICLTISQGANINFLSILSNTTAVSITTNQYFTLNCNSVTGGVVSITSSGTSSQSYIQVFRASGSIEFNSNPYNVFIPKFVSGSLNNVSNCIGQIGSQLYNLGGFTPTNQQNVIYVAKAGNDSNNGLSLDSPKLTFTAALSSAAIGDAIICLDGGTYTESLTFNKQVDIFAPVATLSFTGPTSTLIISSPGSINFGTISSTTITAVTVNISQYFSLKCNILSSSGSNAFVSTVSSATAYIEVLQLTGNINLNSNAYNVFIPTVVSGIISNATNAIGQIGSQLYNLGGGGGSVPNYVATWFVGKFGNDSNSGINTSQPKLTMQNAINSAIGGIGSDKLVNVLDGQSYSENLSIPSDINFYAPLATISGSSGNIVDLNNTVVIGSNQKFIFNTISAIGGSGIVISNANGPFIIEGKKIVSTIFAISCLSPSSTGTINIDSVEGNLDFGGGFWNVNILDFDSETYEIINAQNVTGYIGKVKITSFRNESLGKNQSGSNINAWRGVTLQLGFISLPIPRIELSGNSIKPYAISTGNISNGSLGGLTFKGIYEVDIADVDGILAGQYVYINSSSQLTKVANTHRVGQAIAEAGATEKALVNIDIEYYAL